MFVESDIVFQLSCAREFVFYWTQLGVDPSYRTNYLVFKYQNRGHCLDVDMSHPDDFVNQVLY